NHTCCISSRNSTTPYHDVSWDLVSDRKGRRPSGPVTWTIPQVGVEERLAEPTDRPTKGAKAGPLAHGQPPAFQNVPSADTGKMDPYETEREIPVSSERSAAMESLPGGRRPRLLFCSYHCYWDRSSGAALCTRELLAHRGWTCRVWCGPHLDFEQAPSLAQL